FPPPPPSEELRHHIISGFCEDMSPGNFVQKGCAVCGSLTKFIDLTLKSDLVLDWDLLSDVDVTRRERRAVADPVEPACIG
ncbi:hypothetical protein K438DRAFT_1622437, partial [Mycena galopus ATCC 62051]